MIDEHNSLHSIEMSTIFRETKDVLKRVQANVARQFNNRLLNTYAHYY